MAYDNRTGLEFIEGFSLLAGALWIIGALLVGGAVMLGTGRTGPAEPAATQEPVAQAPATQ